MIRNLKAEDINDIILLEDKTIGETLGSDTLESFINNPLAHMFVIEEESIIGYVSTTFDGNVVEILNLCIDTLHQSNGYGNMLMSYLVNYFYTLNASSIFLEVRESNKKAIGLYTKFGFKMINRRKKYYGSEDALCLEYKFMPQEEIEGYYLDLFCKKEVSSNKIRFYNLNNKDKYYHNFTYYKDKDFNTINTDIELAKEKYKRFIYAICGIDDRKLPNTESSRLQHQSLFSFPLEKPIYKVYKLEEENRDEYFELIYKDSLIYGETYSRCNANDIIDRALIDKKIDIFYVRDETNKMIGSINVICYKNGAKLEDFFVLDMYQHKGYGKSLLNGVVSYLIKNTKVTDLYLVADEFDTYKDMYHRYGFSLDKIYTMIRVEFEDGKN